MVAEGQEVVAPRLGRGLVGGVVETTPMATAEGPPTQVLAVPTMAGVPGRRAPATIAQVAIAH